MRRIRWAQNSASFLSLPVDCFVVLAVEFLETLRSTSLNAGQYQFALDDFHFTELELGQLGAVQGYIGWTVVSK